MSRPDDLYDAVGLWRLAMKHGGPYLDIIRANSPHISKTTYVMTILSICLPPILLLMFFELEASKLRSEEPKGCRKLGIKIDSNLTNEYDPKYAKGFPASKEETSADWWRIKSLWIYPVKGCRGVELTTSTMSASGMEYDRQFTFAQLKSPFPLALDASGKEKTAHKWDVITEHHYKRLANVRTEIWAVDPSVPTYSPHDQDVEGGGVIIISFPYQKSGWRGILANWGALIKGTIPEKQFRVPFNPTSEQIERAGYTYEEMSIWGETVNALNMEIELPEELRYYLGLSNKLGLFRVDDQIQLFPDADEGLKTVTGFQDAHPIHMVNLATIRDHEKRIPKPKEAPRLSARKFRSNIIFIGPVKHSENEWRRIKIGNVYEYLAKPLTSRKEMPDMTFITAPAQTTDQTHNVKLQFTRKPDIAEKSPITCLGMLLIPLSSDSVIKVGDEIRVLRREGDPEETQQSSIRHTYSSLSSLPAPRKYF